VAALAKPLRRRLARVDKRREEGLAAIRNLTGFWPKVTLEDLRVLGAEVGTEEETRSEEGRIIGKTGKSGRIVSGKSDKSEIGVDERSKKKEEISSERRVSSIGKEVEVGIIVGVSIKSEEISKGSKALPDEEEETSGEIGVDVEVEEIEEDRGRGLSIVEKGEKIGVVGKFKETGLRIGWRIGTDSTAGWIGAGKPRRGT
jgi:hypothetical protein